MSADGNTNPRRLQRLTTLSNKAGSGTRDMDGQCRDRPSFSRTANRPPAAVAIAQPQVAAVVEPRGDLVPVPGDAVPLRPRAAIRRRSHGRDGSARRGLD